MSAAAYRPLPSGLKRQATGTAVIAPALVAVAGRQRPDAKNPHQEIIIGRRSAGSNRRDGTRRLTTETKSAYKTTEFFAYVAAASGVLITSYVVKTNENHADCRASCCRRSGRRRGRCRRDP